MVMDNLFPEATTIDVAKTKILLNQYKNKTIIVERLIPETPKQKLVLENDKHMIRTLEKAVNLILDPEIREIITYRYLEGNPRKAALVKYRNFTDRTFDRKVEEGIISVANMLRLWEEI